MAIVRQSNFLEKCTNSSPELDEKLKLRAPYVTPLNVLQVGGRGVYGEYRGVYGEMGARGGVDEKRKLRAPYVTPLNVLQVLEGGRVGRGGWKRGGGYKGGGVEKGGGG